MSLKNITCIVQNAFCLLVIPGHCGTVQFSVSFSWFVWQVFIPGGQTFGLQERERWRCEGIAALLTHVVEHTLQGLQDSQWRSRVTNNLRNLFQHFSSVLIGFLSTVCNYREQTAGSICEKIMAQNRKMCGRCKGNVFSFRYNFMWYKV